jgi:DNA-directed RNA polymerase subunit RPC12/RpoP
MGTCIICGKETARMSGSESVNYIVLEGAEVIACPTCIKKTLLTLYISKHENNGVSDAIDKLANDNTVMFIGDKKQYVKVNVHGQV